MTSRCMREGVVIQHDATSVIVQKGNKLSETRNTVYVRFAVHPRIFSNTWRMHLYLSRCNQSKMLPTGGRSRRHIDFP